MAVTYDVPEGKVFTLAGPATVTVKSTYEEPLIVDSTEDIAAAAPVLSALTPDTAEIGSPSFTLVVEGTNLTAQSIIVFAGQDEPTTLAADGKSVSTGVNMDLWQGADVLAVQVRNGPAYSGELEFTFTDNSGEQREAGAPPRRKRRRR